MYVQIITITLVCKNSCNLSLKCLEFLESSESKIPVSQHNAKMRMLVGKAQKFVHIGTAFAFFLAAALVVQNVLHWIALTYSTLSKMG